MTERFEEPARPQGISRSQARRAGAGRPQRGLRSLSRNPLPAIAAAITAFIVVLALLVARLATGHDPVLRQVAVAPAITTAAGGARRTVLRTTASGRTVVATEAAGGQAPNGRAAGGQSAGSAPLRTRASGGSRADD